MNDSGGTAGVIIGIVFGCLGLIAGAVLIIYYCSKKSSSSASSKSLFLSVNVVKPSSSGKIISPPTPAFRATPAPFAPGNPSYPNPLGDRYKSQFNDDAPYSPYPENPPSYRSAMADDQGYLPWSPNVTPYPSQPEPATASPVGLESMCVHKQ
ncbi:hypothetical protein BaRGS_00001006 [Batillaria attramentaria]|uniref:Uncharacterized protein n=1 Tax=Batillaria attramentaria TaxID=370345 RepID=A0ABD0M9H1_9CAEN